MGMLELPHLLEALVGVMRSWKVTRGRGDPVAGAGAIAGSSPLGGSAGTTPAGGFAVGGGDKLQHPTGISISWRVQMDMQFHTPGQWFGP